MKEHKIILILFLFFILVASLGIHPLPGPYGDNARYIVLAKALIEGKGLRQINFPDAPVEKKIPILYPAMLAALIFIFGYHLIILKISSLVFMALALVLFYLFMRKIKVAKLIGLSVLFLLCISPHILEYSREVLSEAPFIFLISLVTYFMASYEDKNRKSFLYAAIVLACCASLVRDVGLIMLLVITFILFRQKDYKRLLVIVAICIFFIGGWLYKNFGAQTGYLREFISQGNYIEPSNQMLSFGSFLRRYAYEAAAYIGDILPDYIFPAFRTIAPHSRLWLVKIVSGLLFFSLIVYGILFLRRRQKGEFIFFFTLLYGLSLPLFGTYGLRYIIPVSFFIFLGLACSLAEIPLFKHKPVFLSFLVAVMIFNLSIEAKQIAYIRRGYPGAWSNYYQALFYLKANTDKEHVAICGKPYLGYLLSERKTIGYPYLSDPQEMLRYIRNSAASYVIVDGINTVNTCVSQRYLGITVKKYANSFNLVYRIGEPLTEVYRIIR